MSSAAIVLPPLLLVQSVTGAAPQAPAPFPIGPEASNGTARVEGVVTRDGTGEPIPLAALDLTRARNPTDVNAALDQAAADPPPSATTDAGGRFVLEGIAPGEYRITAYRNGFVRQQHGQTEPGAAGPPVTLTAGETLNVEIQMTPAAVITGRIVDERGEPVPHATVSAMRRQIGPDGREGLRTVRRDNTDDRGEYRLFWLDPGEYIVSASASTSSAGATSVSGGLFLTSSNMEPRTDEMAGFYPGVPDEALAAPVTVVAGEERAGVDIRMAAKTTFTVSGRVVSPGPLRGFSMVRMRPAVVSGGAIGALSSLFGGLNAGAVDSQGNFTIRNVEPGAYIVEVQSRGLGGRDLTGSARVEVTNRDVENVALTLTAGIDIAANIFLEEAATPAASEAVSSFDWIQLRITLDTDDILGNSAGEPVDAQGNFQFVDVAPGDYRVRLITTPNRGFYVKRILLGSEEIAPDDPITIGPDFSGPISVLLSPNGGRIDGVASTTNGEPVSNGAIMLLPEDIPSTTSATQMSAIGRTLTDGNGNYSLSGIAPGEYLLFAWEASAQVPFLDPEFIRRFAARGERVVIREGDALNVNLQAITEDDVQ